MQKLVIIYDKNFRYHPYYQKAFQELYFKWIQTYIFVKDVKDEKLDDGVFKYGYNTEEDLIKKVEEIYTNNTFFHTFEEHAIPLVNEMKKYFNQTYTTNYLAFTNKDLQRNLLLNYDKSITVNFLETSLDDLSTDIDFDFPAVVKPVSAAQSRWVKIIQNKDELQNYVKDYREVLKRIWESAGYENENFLIEEFIDGNAWSVDYFVDVEQNIYLAKPIFLEFGIDIWIDDFCNISRVISYETDKKLDLAKLEDFVEKNVKALDIKNTFVHHEFKFTSKWIFKTIELNGRIWGFRLDMYDKTYNINLLDLPFDNYKPWFLENKILTNYAVWAIYPEKRWILKEFNQEVVWNIEKLSSLDQIKLLEKNIWKEIWPSKEWFSRVGFIRLENSDWEQFKKDYEFIREKYLDLLNLE